jgi:hypothetical protein
MSPLDWLCANSPGFANLAEKERQARLIATGFFAQISRAVTC